MWTVLLCLLVLVSLLGLYIYWLRPLLSSWGILKPLPEKFQTVVARVQAFLRWSFTMLLGWIVTLVSTAWALAGQVLAWLQEPEQQAALTQIFSDKPWLVPLLGMAIGVLFLIARGRTATTPTQAVRE